MTGTNYSVKQHHGIDELQQLKPHWLQLSSVCISSAFYHDWYWYAALIENLTRNLTFISIWHVEQLVAVLPVDASMPGQVSIAHCDHTDICDLILHRDHCNADVRHLLLLALNTVRPDWRVFEVRKTPETGAMMALFKGFAWPIDFDADKHSCYFGEPDSSPVCQVPKKLIKNIGRQSRALQRDMGLASIIDTDLETFLKLESQSWKADLHNDVAANRRTVGFYEQLERTYRAENRLHLKALVVGNQTIAVQFGLLSGSSLYLLKIAYHPDFQKYAPGNQMLLSLLEQPEAPSSLTRISLTTGPIWAERWHPHVTPLYNITLFNPTFTGRMSYVKTQIKHRLRPIKQKFLRSAHVSL